MPAVIMLARSTVRGRMAALGWLVLLIALGLGTAIASLTAAWRTEHAYDQYLRAAGVSPLVVNPSLITDRAAETISSTAGVVDSATDTLLAATVDSGRPRSAVDLGLPIQVRYSPDGRYLNRDRPVVHEGRMIRGGAEAFLNLEAADALRVEVGDTVPVAFWPTSEADGRASGPIEPIGKAEVRVVGIGIFANEVLADELYARQVMLVTPDVAARFDCTPPHPREDDPRTFEQLAPSLWPSDCAAMYRYYSLRLADGDAGTAVVLRSLDAFATEGNARLPAAFQTPESPELYIVPAVTAEERARVARSLAPSVTALRLFGIAAGCATLALVLLTLMRLARRAQPAPAIWQQLGATGAQRAFAIGAPLAVSSVAGVAGAVLVGWLASPIGPVASARLVEPNPALVLVWPVVLPVVAGAVLALGIGVAAASILAARVSPEPSRGQASSAVAAAARTGNVPFALGVQAAVRGTGAVAFLAASVAAVSVVLGSAVFGTNLSGVVTTPAKFGWPYDAAVVIGSGYGGANEPAIAKALDRPEVEAWGLAGLGSALIGAEAVPFVAEQTGFGALPVQVVEGMRPATADQIALGTRTAERLGLAVGDTASVTVGEYKRKGTVTGLVVLPPLGPILADRAELGTGVLIPAPFVDEAVAEVARAQGLPVSQLTEGEAGFVALDLRDGVDPARFLAAIDLRTWDLTGYQPDVHLEPVRPAQIADVAALRSAPVLLASLVGFAMVIGMALAIGLAVRARRRELALLRALGATGPQLRATLRWQALVIVGAGLAVGTPLGIALGRITWQDFAADLGVPPVPEVSLLWVLAIVLAALLVALVASALPGRVAARISPSTILRRE